ncbi:DUF309 domain-containing protein [Litorilinea aerophila]|nr:DUF309 domain-containing protein [Litorilinea aerophila]MCC9077527.1 DUF309 domain-containing protein [Litorilinea aerophila]
MCPSQPSHQRDTARDDRPAGQDEAASTLPPAPPPTVVCLEPDLFFAARLEDVIRAAGGKPVTVETPEAFVAAVDRTFPVLALVDLNTPGDWYRAIERCKIRPHTRQVPIYAFGSHVDVETLKAARRAGADHAWARSRMMEQLVDVVTRHVQPPVRYPEGWDDVLPEEARAGVEAFNQGHFFEQHEHFEEAWLAEPRPIREMYQGILQVGVAFLLIQRGKWNGALKMFRRGLPRLRGLPDVCQGIHIGKLRAQAEAIHREITALGPKRLAEFDPARFPKIELVAQAGPESTSTAPESPPAQGE